MEQTKENKNIKEEVEADYGFDEPSFNFFGKKYLTTHGRMIANNKFMFTISIFQLVIIFILIVGYWRLTSQKEFAVHIPDYGIVKVGRMKANELYYKVWGDYVVSRIANFTPTTIRHNVEKASVIFDKASWNHQKPHIDKYMKVIEDNSISQDFSFNDDDVKLQISKDGKNATLQYTGTAHQDINKLSQQTIKCSYTFGFFVDDGRPYQESISTNCLSGGIQSKKQNK